MSDDDDFEPMNKRLKDRPHIRLQDPRAAKYNKMAKRDEDEQRERVSLEAANATVMHTDHSPAAGGIQDKVDYRSFDSIRLHLAKNCPDLKLITTKEQWQQNILKPSAARITMQNADGEQITATLTVYSFVTGVNQGLTNAQRAARHKALSVEGKGKSAPRARGFRH